MIKLTFLHRSDGITGNNGFGSSQLLAKLRHIAGFTSDNIGLNVALSNQTQFLFG
ncbi:hypothetical protein [Nostoc sp. NIES-3756]|uniref:hypothetical protein n=1 Tax=Nostoc sp. NIES-3756 TaxID=1751286 RepID=UPI000AD636B1|nr:hypothetical protein [Nostoc sp. NIES-3756]